MATFQSQVEALVGTTDANRLADWLTAGARFIISLIPRHLLSQFAVTVTVPSSGYDVSDAVVLGASVSSAPARRLDERSYYRASISGSMYESSATDPVYTVQNGSLLVRGASAGGIGELVQFPTVDPIQTTIPNFPAWLEHGVVLFAAIREVVRRLVSTTVPSSASILSALPATVSAPSFTYTDAQAVSAFTVVTGALPTAPTFTKPSAPNILVYPSLDLSAISLPTAPTIDAITYFTVTAGTVSQSTITAPSTAVPVFLRPSLGALATIPADIDIDASFVPPSEPVLVPITYDAATSSSVFPVSIAPLGTAPTFSLPIVDFTTAYTTLTTALSSGTEDIELAQAANSQVQTQIGELKAKIDGQLAKFNEANVTYQASIQTAIRGAEIAAQKAVQDAQQTTSVDLQNKAKLFEARVAEQSNALQAYARKIEAYRIKVEAAVAEYKTNVDKAIQARSITLKQYETEMSAELQRVNGEISIRQLEIQTNIEQARIRLQEAMQNAKTANDVALVNAAKQTETQIAHREMLLKKFQSDLSFYQERINAAIAIYRTQVETITAQQQSALKVYETQLLGEKTSFEAGVVSYQAGVQVVLQDAQAAVQKAQLDAKNATDVNIQNRARQLEAAIVTYKESLEKFQAEIARYQAESQNAVAQYKSNVEGYGLQIQAQTAMFQTLMAQWNDMLRTLIPAQEKN